MAVGGDDGFYMLDKADEYGLDFKVWAYYNTGSKEPLKPTEAGLGVGALPVGGDDGFYTLDGADEYGLDIKVEAYYKISLKSTPEEEDGWRLRVSIYETMASMSLESLQELRKWLDEHGQ